MTSGPSAPTLLRLDSGRTGHAVYLVGGYADPPTRWGQWLTPLPFVVLRESPYLIESLAPCAFRDADGVVWEVPAHTQSDGASMHRVVLAGVRVAERLLGSGSRPEFRRPSLLHDWLCRSRHVPAARAHGLYEPALRADGVAAWRAAVMGAAVRHGGPRW